MKEKEKEKYDETPERVFKDFFRLFYGFIIVALQCNYNIT